MLVVLGAVAIGGIWLFNFLSPLAPATGPVATAGPTADPCTNYDPPRNGWLYDYDRRGEVALRSVAGPYGTIAAVVNTYGIGGSLIVKVDQECLIGGVLYYHVDFEDGTAGWVDLDYLWWEKPKP